MFIGVAFLAVLAFIGWFTARAIKAKSIKAHTISYGIAVIAGVFTYGYLLSLDFPQLIKIVASILLGIILIIFGAMYQRRLAKR